ncbi:MAG TPA: hypothetical protein EYM68_07220 [Gammaproteobacteria bacterium]|jgi:hypothetical protein|nr:hypothetical protein [Gammaproteobacteria bacterium]HIN17677.1 hypothetical protein [Gammaproteobacteria bacterium]
MKALLLIARLLGALRVMLVVSVFILIALAPLVGSDVFYSGWKMAPTLIAPALVPIFFFVILFDVLMCFVCRIDKPAIERQRFDSIVRIELALLVLMVAFWAPAFYRLLDTV